jgi:hypothetical protein
MRLNAEECADAVRAALARRDRWTTREIRNAVFDISVAFELDDDGCDVVTWEAFADLAELVSQYASWGNQLVCRAANGASSIPDPVPSEIVDVLAAYLQALPGALSKVGPEGSEVGVGCELPRAIEVLRDLSGLTDSSQVGDEAS